jgi:hypothetical protein
MLQRDVWVLLPVIYRNEQLRRVLQSLKETAPEIGIVVAVEPDDAKCILTAHEYNAKVAICPKPRAGCAAAWNTALAAAPGTATAYVLAADDVIFHVEWFEAAVRALDTIGGDGLVGFNDCHKQPPMATHYMMTKHHLVTVNGGVIACPHYMVENVEVEAIERAKRAGKYVYAYDAVVEHVWNGRHPDKYFLDSMKWIGRGRRQLEERRKAGWPNDFEAVVR